MLLLLAAFLAQAPSDTGTIRAFGELPPGVVDGWAHTLSGERFTYHSAHPTGRASLLVRSEDSTLAAIWDTDSLPQLPGDTIVISFLAAMDVTDPGQTPVSFWVTIDGEHRFRLPQPTSPDSTWSLAGPDGVRLDFRRLMIDKFADVHGLMTLRLPRALITPGRPIRIRVAGETVGRRSWFILYTTSIRPALWAEPEEALIRENGGLRQVLRLTGWNPDVPAQINVRMGGVSRLATLSTGATTLRLPLARVTAPLDIPISVTSDHAVASWSGLRIDPVVERTIYLINHAHLDIGYTDYQPNVRRKHWETIDSAVAFIERSRNGREGERFRWNIEGQWPLEGYLTERDSTRRESLVRLIRSGDIAISAFYANLMTGLSSADELVRSLSYTRTLRRLGMPVTMAMTSDVPGFTWGVVPSLSHNGIRYLSSGPNFQEYLPKHGDRIGWTIDELGDRPFWWMGPSGRDSVLTWVAGRGYSWAGGFPKGRIRVEDADVVTSYMADLRRAGYPYDMVQLRYAIGGDNGVPDGHLADEVRRWNETFASPRLVISTVPELFAAFEKKYGAAIPRLRGDFTGYWEDGAMSTAREQVMNRASGHRLGQAAALAAIRGARMDPKRRWDAWREVTLWSEHTWGADRSISDPDDPGVAHQWQWKAERAERGDSLSRGLLGAAGPDEPASNAVDIWNTSIWPAPGVVQLPAWLTRRGDRARATDGTALATQRLANGALAVTLPTLQPLGATRVILESGLVPRERRRAAKAAGDSIWNDNVSVRVDLATGAVRSVRWRGKQLVAGASGGWAWYRYLLGRDTSKTRSARDAKVEIINEGPVVATIRVTATGPGSQLFQSDISLDAEGETISISVTMDKLPVRAKESVHLGFPFRVPGGTVRFEQPFAVVRPDSDQLAAANRQLFPAQRWIDISNEEFGITLATPDTPLWEVGGLTAEAFRRDDGIEQWLRRALPGTTLYAYLMNNYWHTNFKADQSGPVTFRFIVEPHGPYDPRRATVLGSLASEPPLATPAESGPSRWSLFRLDNAFVEVSGLAPTEDGKGVIMRLWNTSDQSQSVGFQWPNLEPKAVWLSDEEEHRSVEAPARIPLPPYGYVVVRIDRRNPPP